MIKGIVKSKLPVHVITLPLYSEIVILPGGLPMIKRGMPISSQNFYYGTLRIREDGKDKDTIIDVPLNIYLDVKINERIKV